MAEARKHKDRMLTAMQSQPAAALEASVKEVLESSDIFTFGEFLLLPQFESGEAEAKGPKKLLELFAYGTWREYQARQGEYPRALSPTETKKLKMLSILDLSAREKALKINDVLESISTDRWNLYHWFAEMFKKGLLDVKIDEANDIIEIRSVAPRDVRPEDVSELYQILVQFRQNVQGAKDQGGAVNESLSAAHAKQEQDMLRLEVRGSAGAHGQGQSGGGGSQGRARPRKVAA